MSQSYEKSKKTSYEIPLRESYPPPPASLTRSRKVDDIFYVAPEGIRETDIMFIFTAVNEDQASTSITTEYGTEISVQPGLYRGAVGTMIKDVAMQNGIDVDKCFSSSLIKWIIPKQYRTKPRVLDIQQGAALLRKEIEYIKPRIIITFGKPAFQFVTGLRLPLRSIAGGFLRSEEFNCTVFPMEDPFKLLTQPEFLERFHVDFREVKRLRDIKAGRSVEMVEQNYRVIRSKRELEALVYEWEEADYNLFSVDCEWHGSNHIDGKLRSIQFCWAPGEAVYVRFMDDQLNYVFDCSYTEAGQVLGQHLNKKKVRYIGHHFAADAPWMHHVLNLDWYNKCAMDTEFGVQTCDENAELALERLCMAYTDLGRWDLDLTLWCRDNKALVADGYGLIPDEILIPYACKDVDGPFRVMPFVIGEMVRDNTLAYFNTIFLPFVTNVFTQFALTGLPMDMEKMDELREVFNFAKHHMEIDFREGMVAEADNFLLQLMLKYKPEQAAAAFTHLNGLIKDNRIAEATNFFKETVGTAGFAEHRHLLEHRINCPVFNIRSVEQMRRWLFKIKGFTPVKSVANRAKGIPSMDWGKVLELPLNRRKDISPAVDKQSLEIFEQNGDRMMTDLLQLNAVGNLCKAFLKPADVDPDSGQPVKENGLHFWVASDGRVHGQTSTTETGRPRSWKPNILNWPSWVNKKISGGMERMFQKLHDKGELPERYVKYLKQKLPSIRSCVDVTKLPPLPGSKGWCLVESDYATAEIRGLAFIAGDDNLIRLMTTPDTDFGIWKDATDEDYDRVRLNFSDSSGIDPRWVEDKLLMGCVVAPTSITKEEAQAQWGDNWVVDNEGSIRQIIRLTEDDLVKNSDGSIKNPSHDLHWSLSEMSFAMPREYLNRKKDRGGAKVGNFSSAYGATGRTIERKIESDTGTKPEEGTGDRILEALAKRQPRATAFLEKVELAPKEEGFLEAKSGRRRHFITHPDNMGVDWRTKNSKLSALGREARNFFMQESVASTAARAGNWLLDFYRRFNLKARPMTILYDSVVTLCPVEEREIIALAHQVFMCDINTWEYHGRKMTYPIDGEYNMAWSWKPSPEQKENLHNMEWAPLSEDLIPIKKFLLRVTELGSYEAAIREVT
jgi:uracil-DNA glycosylase family 4